MYSIDYGTTKIHFDIVRKKNLKNTYIHIDTNGVVVKTNTKTTISQINEMVKNKSSWITKKLELFKTITINREITTGSRLYYMGKSYYVNMIKDSPLKTISIKFTHSKFHIYLPPKYNHISLHNAIERFYKQKAIEKITPLMNKWAKIMEVNPSHISFRVSKKSWGSCSGTNRISFNYHLIKLSTSLIEYVVIHELAHIIHKNHSKEFWKLVRKYMNDYKVREEKIRVFEKLI